jgi:hypothetical protein
MSRNESAGIQDQIKVKIRREKGGKFEDLLIRVAVKPMNGTPVVFGRGHRDGCDRDVNVAEVAFRNIDEFELFNQYNPYAARMPTVFRVESAAFSEPRQL